MTEDDQTQTSNMILYPAGDQPRPLCNKNFIRLYDHNLCPFASRARYSLALTQRQFQIVQTCLNNKAPWHVEANGGMVPLFETSDGVFIKESAVISMYAWESRLSNCTVDLVPNDPVQAALMRLKIEYFGKECLQTLISIYMTRGEDSQKIDSFAKQGLINMEQICADANGGWLSGEEQPNFMDVHCAPWLEMLCLFEGGVMQNVVDQLDLHKNAPHMVSYVKRWQEHPLIKPYRMRKLIADRHWERTRGWKQGEKCQLSYDILLDGAFD